MPGCHVLVEFDGSMLCSEGFLGVCLCFDLGSFMVFSISEEQLCTANSPAT